MSVSDRWNMRVGQTTWARKSFILMCIMVPWRKKRVFRTRTRPNFGFIVITIIKLSFVWRFMLFEQVIKFMIVLASTFFELLASCKSFHENVSITRHFWVFERKIITRLHFSCFPKFKRCFRVTAKWDPFAETNSYAQVVLWIIK